MENGLASRMIFDEPIHLSRTGGDHTAPRKPSPSVDFSMDGDKMFDHRESSRGLGSRTHYGSSQQNSSWNVNLDAGSSGGDGDGDESDDDEDDDDDDLEDDEIEDGEGGGGEFGGGNSRNGKSSNGSVHSSEEKGSCSQEHHSGFGLSRVILAKDGNLSGQQNQHERGSISYENAITVVEPEMYCAQILHGVDGSNSSQKEMGGENGYGFSSRKDFGLFADPRETLRTHLSDPMTGVLMDDAMILPCGHSYGRGGIQYVFRMKACCKCSQRVSEELVRPNLALRSAVQAFRREEESQFSKASKRRRDRFEQDKGSYDDPLPMDSRGKGVQFPFVVSDRVLIKGNKRTPERFVGRVAVVTTQCLNGWYVVKTLDNAESVKLQYRSLAKVPDDSAAGVIQNKSVPPNWL